MDHELNPYEDSSGEQPPDAGRSGRRIPRVAATVGLTAFLGLAGAGAAFAFTGSGSPTSSTSGSSSTTTPSTVPGAKPFGPGRGFGPMFGHLLGPGGPVVHGQYTVKTSTGYQTVLEQIGTVVKASSSEIEVKSSDGYDHTYAVVPTTVVDAQANGISTVTAGDNVILEAVQQSGKDTATNIVDTTKIGSSRTGFGFGRMKLPTPPFGAGTPGAPGASGTSPSTSAGTDSYTAA